MPDRVLSAMRTSARSLYIIGAAICWFSASAFGAVCLPTSGIAEESTQIATAQRPDRAVVFVNGAFAVYVPSDALLKAVEDESVIYPGDLVKSLRRYLPLKSDLRSEQLVDDLVEQYRGHPDENIRESIVRRRTKERIQYAVAALLLQSNAAVIDVRTGAPLKTIQVVTKTECGITQGFFTPAGESILSVVIAIV